MAAAFQADTAVISTPIREGPISQMQREGAPHTCAGHARKVASIRSATTDEDPRAVALNPAIAGQDAVQVRAIQVSIVEHLVTLRRGID